MYFDISLKLLSQKNTQKVNKQNIWDSENWVFGELNKVTIFQLMVFNFVLSKVQSESQILSFM